MMILWDVNVQHLTKTYSVTEKMIRLILQPPSFDIGLLAPMSKFFSKFVCSHLGVLQDYGNSSFFHFPFALFLLKNNVQM
jgi:hypothetical protein